MIINQRQTRAGIVELSPTSRQNKYLRGLGAVKTYGTNFNGYGYADTVRVYELSPAQIREYNSLGKIMPKPALSEEEREDRWCKRLVKFTGITMAEAEDIAREKYNYHIDRINALVERDCSAGYASKQRGKLISKLERENPLRYIKDATHAVAILAASNRHKNTNYENKLEEGRELAAMGEIERDEVRDYARREAA